jgi:Cu-Zn family superoxide dismutase
MGLVCVMAACGAGALLRTGHATLGATTPGSAVAGTVTLTEQAEGLHVAIRVTGVAAGDHGIHIHEQGSCAEAGLAAGGHFNPAQAPHGLLPQDGPHKAHGGDLGNITVQADGTGTLEATLPGVLLKDVTGRAMILHEKRDDFGQPTGNAGGRIGCGIIEEA